MGDKIMGDQQTITTDRGDYATGHIDQRQGIFIGRTMYGDVILPPSTGPQALHQLRAPVGDFVGREEEINRLVRSLGTAAESGTAAISGVRGLGGVGKTELAYAVAHQLVPAFPDAHLLIDL